MADSYEIALAETKFSQVLELALQQMGSKLRDTVHEQAISGAKQASPVQQIEAVVVKPVNGRFSPKAPTPNQYTRRWVMPNDYIGDTLIDNFDLLKTQIDPKGETVRSWAMACGRAFDDQIISAATGNASIGTDANSFTTETFDTSAFQVSVDFGGTASGALVAKLIEGMRILEHYHNDLEMEQPTWVIGSSQHADLKKQSQVISSEFNKAGGVVQNGRVTELFGARIKVTERLPLTSANTRGTLLYVPSGMVLGVWQDIKTQIVQRFDLESNPWDVSTVLSHGATRTRPGKVLQLLCHDTSGADITP